MARATPTRVEKGALIYASQKAEAANGAPAGSHDGLLQSNLVYNTTRTYMKMLDEMLDHPGADRLSELTGRKKYIVERLLADNGPPKPVRWTTPRNVSEWQRTQIARMARAGKGAAEIAEAVGLGGATGRKRVYSEVRRLVDRGELPSRPLQRREASSAGSAAGLE